MCVCVFVCVCVREREREKDVLMNCVWAISQLTGYHDDGG